MFSSRARRPAIVLIAVLLSFVPTAQSRAAERPTRSGTILGGVFVMGPGATPRCGGTPDCIAWQTAGCPAHAAGVDPALTASIVDVAGLGGTQHRFAYGIGEPVGLEWGAGVVVQFWTKQCEEIPYAAWVSKSAVRRYQYVNQHATQLWVPRDARWMTVVAGYDAANLTWTLQ